MSSISVIMPVFNGKSTIGRSIGSVIRQTVRDWELLVVDDSSSDGSYHEALRWAKRERRIHVLRTDENRGPGAARNIGLAKSHSKYIAYLDCDDEYHPHYLATALRHLAKADVVICGYDVYLDEDETSRLVHTWNPTQWRMGLMARNMSTPLGVSHRREMVEQAGGFNELLWNSEDWELWRRLARRGAEFVFPPVISGRYHVRAKSQNRSPNIPSWQRKAILDNRSAGYPLYSALGMQKRLDKACIEQIAFVSPHSAVDPSSGAAVATLRSLQALQRAGFKCQVLCGSLLDFPSEELIEELLAKQGVSYEERCARFGEHKARLLFTQMRSVPITVFCAGSTARGFTDSGERDAFADACGRFLTANRPDVVLTFGGQPAGQMVSMIAKGYDIPVVFSLHNFAYRHIEAFRWVDYVIVPSEYSRRFYWDRLGLDCTVLPNIIDDETVRVTDRQPRYVTLVNPQAAKGVYVFGSIASELARRRPDIPLLVVEGRGTTDVLREAEIDSDRLGNISLMPNTPRPHVFYEVTKLLLMPSLWNESFGLVAAEAMFNGIPVLASNRGALPEVVGEGGYLFEIPARYTPQTRDIPTAEEVEPWIETIIRLWDDPQEYAAACDRARNHAQRWHPDRLAPIYREFFSNLAPQPFPPLAPPGVR
ncbi:MAG: glycosyltransferase [Planctomycetaceae bacterium]|nr:glycosyltransferase [Planctomycetaceae bacterium]